MTGKFPEKWEGTVGGIKGAVRSVKPLKTQIDNAVRRIERQANRINGYIEHYTRRDRELSERIVQAYERRDEARAKMLANELAEIRKHKDLLMSSKTSLDKAALRLRTIYEFGNFMSVISSAKETVKNVHKSVSNLIPGVSLEFDQIEKMLSDVAMDVTQNAGLNLNFDVESDEAGRILEEAAIIAESKIKFPASPKDSSSEKSQ